LFDEAVVILFVVAAAGEGEVVVMAPDFGGVVDKFGAVIAGKRCFLWNSKTGKGAVLMMSVKA
jgi:hypothetical protein